MVNEINKIWCRVLCLDEVINNEKFYEIGGNSITLIMILDEVSKQFNYDLPTTDVYLFDTVQKMSDFIDKEQNKG